MLSMEESTLAWCSSLAQTILFTRPDIPRIPADVVNLGYVINVIEDTAER